MSFIHPPPLPPTNECAYCTHTHMHYAYTHTTCTCTHTPCIQPHTTHTHARTHTLTHTHHTCTHMHLYTPYHTFTHIHTHTHHTHIHTHTQHTHTHTHLPHLIHTWMHMQGNSLNQPKLVPGKCVFFLVITVA